MTTQQIMREGLYEGILYIFLKADEAMEVGDVVMLHNDSAGHFSKCTSAGVPFGICAEKVTTAGVSDYEPGGLVSHTAKVGDYVGVYIGGGVYWAKDPTDSMTFGLEFYAGTDTAGKADQNASASNQKVGIVVEAENSDHYFKFKSYL